MKRSLSLKEKAAERDAIKRRADAMGYACVGYALDALERK